MLKAGMILGERYEIIECIGTGGMADVYKGKDLKLNRFIAVKVLKKEFREDKNFVAKFQVEAQSAAGLSHSNIVNVYDVGEESGLYYIVMELIEGITLKEYVQKKGRLSAKETISIAIQVSLGMEAAHRNHIIHRDIKPQNIIISKEGKVKVTDFGIARAASSETISSNAMGSVHYTSPEQARGGYSDSKSDIYSLGITMYEMVTGRVPYDGDTTVAIAIKHLQEQMVEPSYFAEDIPFSLEQIILKCTQKSPDRRYQNMGELINDLKHSLMDPDGDFVVIAPPGYAGRTVMFGDDEIEKINDRTGQLPDLPDEEELAEDFEEDEEVNPKIERIMKILSIVVGAIILCIVLFLVGKAAGGFNIGSDDKKAETKEESNKKVEVPNVVGMDYNAAKKKLNKLGLGIAVEKREPSDKYDIDKITSQSKKKGTEVKKNTTIKVVVSTGLETGKVTVPALAGKTEAEAEKALAALDLTIKTTHEYNETVAAGTVISSNPASGAKVKEGATVTVVVSKGPEKSQTVAVPDLRKMTDAQARSTLANAGLAVGSVNEVYSDSVPSGSVVSQGTSVGTEVAKGTAISYTVSKGPEPANNNTNNTTPPADNTPDPVATVSVPNLVGKTESEARSELAARGLKVGNVNYVTTPTVQAGLELVTSQTVEAGKKVTAGTTVGFTVGKNPTNPDDQNTPNAQSRMTTYKQNVLYTANKKDSMIKSER